MGEVGIIETDDKVFLGQRLVSYRTAPQKLLNRFLLWAFQSQPIQEQIKAKASGSTVQHMRVPDTKTLKIALPPISTQLLLIDQLDTLSSKTHQLKALYTQKLNDLKELKQSLLQQAFAGELTKEDAA
jgi:type I restriction enzyme S subunit